MLVIAPKPVELPCHITQGHPLPIVKYEKALHLLETAISMYTLRWFHNNVELKLSTRDVHLKYVMSSSSSLLLLHTTKHDSGNYRCMVTNEAGQDAIDFRLDVYGKDNSKFHLFLLIIATFVLEVTFFNVLSEKNRQQSSTHYHQWFAFFYDLNTSALQSTIILCRLIATHVTKLR